MKITYKKIKWVSGPKWMVFDDVETNRTKELKLPNALKWRNKNR